MRDLPSPPSFLRVFSLVLPSLSPLSGSPPATPPSHLQYTSPCHATNESQLIIVNSEQQWPTNKEKKEAFLTHSTVGCSRSSCWWQATTELWEGRRYGDPLLRSRSSPFLVGAGAAPLETAPKGWRRIRPQLQLKPTVIILFDVHILTIFKI